MICRSSAVLAALLLSFHSQIAQAAAAVALNSASSLRFASVEEGRAVLGNADAFTAALSPFDRSARRTTARDVSQQEFLAFASDQALPWSDAEVRRLQDILAPIGRLFYDKGLRFPSVVLLVKSSGYEEGHAPYHRANAIVLPAGAMARSSDTLHEIIVHELFHVLTGSNPELQQALYRVIGFGRCGVLHLPPSLAARKITNPDAPGLGHCASIGSGSGAAVVFPVLLSSAERYDPETRGGLADYIDLDLVVAEWRDGRWQPKHLNGMLTRLSSDQLRSFIARIGSNTSTSAHPEEILADNFVLLVSGARNVATPWVIAAIDKVLGWTR